MRIVRAILILSKCRYIAFCNEIQRKEIAFHSEYNISRVRFTYRYTVVIFSILHYTANAVLEYEPQFAVTHFFVGVQLLHQCNTVYVIGNSCGKKSLAQK